MVWCSRHKDVLAQNISVSESCGSDACNPPSHHQKQIDSYKDQLDKMVDHMEASYMNHDE